ncbi:MAG: DUF3606 domain-containing protein [Myxococcota bacterium]
MPDDKTIREPHDKKRIDINDPKELRNWSDSLGVSQEELIRAVQAVGTSASAVRAYLSKN